MGNMVTYGTCIVVKGERESRCRCRRCVVVVVVNSTTPQESYESGEEMQQCIYTGILTLPYATLEKLMKNGYGSDSGSYLFLLHGYG